MGKNHKRAKKSKLTPAERRLVEQVNQLIVPHGCRVTGLGPQAVGVLGDAREVGVAVIVQIGKNADAGTISSMVTNRVRGVTRVLMDV